MNVAIAMALADDYLRQHRWRQWAAIFRTLPRLDDRLILDLGCAVGDQAAELVSRGARVIGIDADEALLQTARSRNLPDAEFRSGDLRRPLDVDEAVDGIWCSFTAAYLCDLASALSQWSTILLPGGWIAVTEVDDLFGHEPLAPDTAAVLEAYAGDALRRGRYDFHMGHKLPSHLEAAGFRVDSILTIEDRELSFSGPAPDDVLDAWAARLDRMTLLRDFCTDFDRVRQTFLDCLAHPDHRSRAAVWCCLAGRPA